MQAVKGLTTMAPSLTTSRMRRYCSSTVCHPEAAHHELPHHGLPPHYYTACRTRRWTFRSPCWWNEAVLRVLGLCHANRAATLRHGLREQNGDQERTAVEELLDVERHAELLQTSDARCQEVHSTHRAPDVEPAGPYGGCPKERASKGRQ